MVLREYDYQYFRKENCPVIGSHLFLCLLDLWVLLLLGYYQDILDTELKDPSNECIIAPPGITMRAHYPIY